MYRMCDTSYFDCRILILKMDISKPRSLFFIGYLYMTCLWISITGYCPDPQGNHVAWWVLYQQKSLPFIHYYSDSENNHDIKLQFPEKKESVLAKAINKILQNEFDQYMVYSSDIYNAVKIALGLPVPSFLKWSHGIIAMDSSLSKGFWILHNNLFFPAFQGRHFAEPGGNVWKDTTIGDSTDNVFYVCISAGNKENIQQMIASILAGNPSVHKSNPATLFENVHHLLGLKHMPYNMGTDDENILFAFSTNGNREEKVFVYTKRNGSLISEKSYCYSQDRKSHENPLGLSETNVKKAHDFATMETIFAISDNPASERYGTTCFGQDVAAYIEIVTVMVCMKLPLLHNDLLRSSIITPWFCSNEE